MAGVGDVVLVIQDAACVKGVVCCLPMDTLTELIGIYRVCGCVCCFTEHFVRCCLLC